MVFNEGLEGGEDVVTAATDGILSAAAAAGSELPALGARGRLAETMALIGPRWRGKRC